ncbi:MAG: lamin tail domain-containing protein [Patescibacteria group bacterium]
MLVRFLLSTLFLAPAIAFGATIEIAEVQYNPDGSDKGREWVRILNTSGAPLDLTGWKFVEAGVNHNIQPVDTAIIPVGGYAIIADNAVQYFADNLNTPDVLFDSAFSLSNTGETISFVDASKNIAATKTYVAAPTQVAAAAAAPKIKSQKSKGESNSAAPQIESDQARVPLIAAPAASGAGLWPWLLGLGVLVVLGGAALFFVPSGTKSGYEIIETHD